MIKSQNPNDTGIAPFTALPHINPPQFPKEHATKSIIAFSINASTGRVEVYKDFHDQNDEERIFTAVQYALQDHWEQNNELWHRGTNAA